MSTKIELGKNCLFFQKSYYTGGKVTGMTTTECAVVCTKDYIFIVPKRETSSMLVATKIKTYNWGDGLSMEQGVERLLKDPGTSLEEAEAILKEVLGENDHDRVLKIADLSHFKVHMAWIMSQARIKHKAGGAIKVVNCKGKGAMRQFKDFYFPA